MSAGRIVIAGGSGFIGRALAKTWAAVGYEVVVLSRGAERERDAKYARFVFWDGKSTGEWVKELDGARAVVNLTGKNVNCRYTEKNLREIDESRVDSVNAVAAAIRACQIPPAVWVQASTTAIYGDAGDRPCDESTPPGNGIPPQTASKWETAFNSNPTPGVRRVLLRISFALGADGGALQMLAGLTRAFLGGAAGSGKQMISWIHIDDLVRVFTWALENNQADGIYNVATPNPVTNSELMRQLRRTLHRPWAPPTPSPLVHVGCFFMRTEPVLALTGRWAPPTRLQDAGFEFQHPKLPAALDQLLR